MPLGQLNYSNFEYLNNSGKVNKFTEQIIFSPVGSDEVLVRIILEFLIHINSLN